MITRIKAEWIFDTRQGYSRRTKVYNATWLALERVLPYRVHRRVMDALR